MKVVVIGSGGREHALCCALLNSPKVSKIYCIPGNAGTNDIAENVANLTTLEDQNTGLPWQKRFVVLEPDPQGVRVVRVGKSTAPFGKYFDPAVPQSNEMGFTAYPNVNLPDEMVNLAYTENIFEANITAYKATKAVYQSVVDMLK